MGERIRKDEVDREKIVAAFDNHSAIIADLCAKLEQAERDREDFRTQLLRSCDQRDVLQARARELEEALKRARELWRMYKATLPGLNARDSFGLCVCCGRKPYEDHADVCYLANMDAALTRVKPPSP